MRFWLFCFPFLNKKNVVGREKIIQLELLDFHILPPIFNSVPALFCPIFPSGNLSTVAGAVLWAYTVLLYLFSFRGPVSFITHTDFPELRFRIVQLHCLFLYCLVHYTPSPICLIQYNEPCPQCCAPCILSCSPEASVSNVNCDWLSELHSDRKLTNLRASVVVVRQLCVAWLPGILLVWVIL